MNSFGGRLSVMSDDVMERRMQKHSSQQWQKHDTFPMLNAEVFSGVGSFRIRIERRKVVIESSFLLVLTSCKLQISCYLSQSNLRAHKRLRYRTDNIQRKPSKVNRRQKPTYLKSFR